MKARSIVIFFLIGVLLLTVNLVQNMIGEGDFIAEAPISNATINSGQDSLVVHVNEAAASANRWKVAKFWATGITLVLGVLAIAFDLMQHSATVRKEALQAALNQLRSQSTSLEIAKTNDRASSAAQRAGEASERAAKIEKVNLQLRIDLEAESSNSRSKQAELEQEQQKTAQAQQAAALAQLELKKYINAIARGSSRPTNDDLFLTKLRMGAPKRVEVLYQGGAPETYLFANSILGLLQRGGWTVIDPNPKPIDTLIGLGGGTALNEIFIAMRRTERSIINGSTEGAIWNAILTLERNCGQVQDS